MNFHGINVLHAKLLNFRRVGTYDQATNPAKSDESKKKGERTIEQQGAGAV